MKLKLLSIPVLIALVVSLPVHSKANDWNQDLSKMMDGLEKEVGPNGNHTSPNNKPADSAIKGSNSKTPSDANSNTKVKEPDPSPPSQAPDSQALPPEPGPISRDKKSLPEIDTKNLIENLSKMEDNYLGAIAAHGLTRWPQETMPLKVFIEPKSNVKNFQEEFPLLLKNAFLAWTDYKDSKIRLAFTTNLDEAHIVCRWTDDKTELMSLLEGGNTVIVPDDNGILSVDMKILTLPPPGASSVSANYISRVCLHEAGHALGLTGHSPRKEDVMFSTVYASDPPLLSGRDLSSLKELYKLDQQTILSMHLDQARALKEIPKEFDNPQINAVKLNNDAAQALKSSQFEIARKKLERAYKLDPHNKLVCSNLGAVYANYGSIAAMTYNLPVAYDYFKKSVPLLEKGRNKQALLQVLPNYMRILKLMKKETEYKLISQKLISLQH